MNLGNINVKLTITAQVGDGESHEVGTADVPLPVTIGVNGKASFDLETAIRDALCGCKPVACDRHRPVQHRDGKPPWCNTCGQGTE